MRDLGCAGELSLAIAALLMFPACATVGPPQPPSLELPRPPADLRAVRKGDRVLLSWSVPTLTTDRQAVRSLGTTRICRGATPRLADCATPAGEVPAPAGADHERKSQAQKTAAHYTDTLPPERNTAAFMTYGIEVQNTSGRSAGLSNQVRVSLAPVLPPPQDFAARVTSGGVVLTWTTPAPASADMTYRCRVYRRLETSSQFVPVGEVPVAGSTDHTFTDGSIEWEKTYLYKTDIVTVVAQEGAPASQVEGDDTAEIKVFAHDIFPPAIPGGLQAVFSGPGQQPFIDLLWAPVPDLDLAGYNVYRREEGGAPQKLNAELVASPSYRDPAILPQKNYFYSVSAVDVRGNESARSEETSERVP